MVIHIHEDARITLDDADTFTAFSVQAPGRSSAEAAALFGADAQARDEDHLWVSIARLRALGRAHGSLEWQRGCDGMLSYAGSKGWVDDEKRMVRAHIER